jgi:hypothetical protein
MSQNMLNRQPESTVFRFFWHLEKIKTMGCPEIAAALAVPIVFYAALIKESRLVIPSLKTSGYYLLGGLLYSLGFLFAFEIHRILIDVASLSEADELLGAYTLSCAVGFLTPGSPGGMGVPRGGVHKIGNVISRTPADTFRFESQAVQRHG